MSTEPKSSKVKGSENEKRRLTAIVLAAGHGTRMKSPLPKVLHPVAGRPMIERTIKTVQALGADEIRVVLGYGKDLIGPIVSGLGCTIHEQKEQKGTGHAVLQAGLESIEGDVLIVNGDHPLITAPDLKNIVREYRDLRCELAVVTVQLKKPASFGRIVRHHGELRAIVEVKDASAETLKIREVNTGIYIGKADLFAEFLPAISSQNAQKEYYLTDVISLALEGKRRVRTIAAPSRVAKGVNTQAELAECTRKIFQRKTLALMESGVVFIEPRTCYIEETVQIGAGSVVYPGVFLRGDTQIGHFCVLEPNVFISDSEIAESTQIKANSHLESCTVGANCRVGPFARLRAGTVLDSEVHVGNFVELKKTQIGKGSKANHLSYLGDAEIGANVNIGCGTITCNYAVDRKKHKTKIGDNVFVGSDTQFVAPIEIGEGAVIGSGSTITKNVPPFALAVARGRQVTKENYVALRENLTTGSGSAADGKTSATTNAASNTANKN